jgi:CO dehydrogenase nickel-insertion accessory protein CooC1
LPFSIFSFSKSHEQAIHIAKKANKIGKTIIGETWLIINKLKNQLKNQDKMKKNNDTKPKGDN